MVKWLHGHTRPRGAVFITYREVGVKMLVQCAISEIGESTEPRRAVAYCCRCHKEVGYLDPDELQAMMSGRYGDIICFQCEDIPPSPITNLPVGVRRKLLTLFGIEDLAELPVSANSAWVNDRDDVRLQLSPSVGWCFWIQDPDGRRWQLRKVHASAKEAQSLKDAYCMLPSGLR